MTSSRRMRRTPTIGILCEGEMTDAPVVQTILEHLFPNVSFTVRGVSKKVIFDMIDIELRHLFENHGAERVAIVWDLLPVGDQMGLMSQQTNKANRREQVLNLLNRITDNENTPAPVKAQATVLLERFTADPNAPLAADQPPEVIKLICVCYALDGWLLSDGELLRRMASSGIRTAPRWNPPHPDECKNPAREIRSYFGNGHNKRLRSFNKHQHNRVVIQQYIEDGRIAQLQKSGSFTRLIDTITRWTS